MGHKFFVPGEERAARVGDLFAAIAHRYDRINDLQSFGLHRRWKHRLVRLAAVQPGERALDVCCGTGDIAFALARHGAVTVGLDFSDAMLAVARQRAERGREAGRPAVGHTRAGAAPQFVRGDALHLPFPDGSFQIVTVGYGLRNLARWEEGLAEMRRVARPGGRLLALDFGKPDNVLWRWLYFTYLRWFVPVLGRLFCADAQAYSYILESLRHYPAQHGVAARLRQLGCTEVRLHNLLGGVMTIHSAVNPAAP